MKLRVITTENPPEVFEASRIVVQQDQGTLTVRCFAADDGEPVQEARFAPSAWQSYRLDGGTS